MKLFTLDFETYYDTDYTLKKCTTEEYIRDPRFEIICVSLKEGTGLTKWFSGSHEEIAEFLSPVEGHAVLAHNTRFDGAILEWILGLRARMYLDTMSMARPLHGLDGRLSLEWLVDHYGLGVKGTEVVRAKGKRRRDFSREEMAAYAGYCINDTNLTHKLLLALKPHINTGEMKVIDVLLRMFIRPQFVLNEQILGDHLVKVQEAKAALLAEVEETAGKDALASNPKFAEVLLSLGVEPPMKLSPAALKKGKEEWTYAFAKGDVEFKALLEHEDPRVQAVVAARMGVKSTIEETRTTRFIGLAQRGPMPIPLKYCGAHTTRASGDDSINAQNLSRGGALRDSMEAPPGYVVVTCDSAQIEAREVAHLAGQTDLVDAFRRKEDIYSQYATLLYKRPVNRKLKATDEAGVTYYPFEKEGRVGKEAILGMGFGMGPDKFQLRLKVAAGIEMDLAVCQEAVDLYRTKYRKIKELWRAGRDMLGHLVNGYTGTLGVGTKLEYGDKRVWLPNGLALYYPKLRRVADGFAYSTKKGASWQDVYIHGAKAIENVVQAVARVIVFDQMVQIDQQLYMRYGGKCQCSLTVHDEVVAIVPKEDEQWARDMMEREMSRSPGFAPDLPIVGEVGSGLSYGAAK